MSKILFIGDPHLRTNNFQQSVQLLHWIEEVANTYNPDIVCNLGDSFHDHATLRSELLKEFYDHATRIAAKMPYWYVLGNHDMHTPRSSKYHALQTFNINNFTVFDKVSEIDNITVVPYLVDHKDFPTTTKSICITHNTFIGSDYGFKIENTGVDADSISADIIISGHIHKRQSFGKVIYPGTPIAHNANDVDQSKGLMLFDTTTHEQQFIESPFPNWKSLEFAVNSSFTTQDLHTTLTSLLNSKDKWVLKISGYKVELTAYFESKQYLQLISDKSVTIKSTFLDTNKNNKIQIKSLSDFSIISEYIDKVYSGTIDKNTLLDKVQQILKNIP
jgi:DNA repair exonuclease SbcCD nuclease subunit